MTGEEPRQFLIDGMVHDIDVDICECKGTQSCEMCGGKMHRQPVYAGAIYVCCKCNADYVQANKIRE